MYYVYKLTFDNGYYYVGQTKDLSSRVNGHYRYWKRKHNLNIKRVDI